MCQQAQMIECLTAPIALPCPIRGALAAVERLQVAVVGADRGHRGVFERVVEPLAMPLRVRAGALLAGGVVVAGALPGPGGEVAAEGKTLMSGPISAMMTSAVRRSTPGIVHSSSTAAPKGASRSSIASESRSICSSRKSRWARIAPISSACSVVEAALERLAQRRDLLAQPALGQLGEHARGRSCRARARRASPGRRRRGCRVATQSSLMPVSSSALCSRLASRWRSAICVLR